MKKIILCCFVVFGLMGAGYGQTDAYNDVGVIVNDNSAVSVAIGQYFRQARNIPAQNLIHIQTVTDEVIDTTEYRNIRNQVKNKIIQNGLQNQLNYLVTTKGMPLDIVVDDCSIGAGENFMECGSVESELALLFREGNYGTIVDNPYYSSWYHFDHDSYDMLLVSRLDGYTTEDVYALIDRSGPESLISKFSDQFIFDISFVTDPDIFNTYAEQMYPAIGILNSRGWMTTFHGDQSLLLNQDHVAGFVGFFYNIVETGLNYSWTNGSFAELILSGPEFTFYDSLNFSNNLQLSDLIGEGAASASGYVHPLFAYQITDYSVFFDRYTDERPDKYNLAESYYMATKKLSWMNVLVGDPKTTLEIESPVTATENRHSESRYFNNLYIYPNPSDQQIGVFFNNENQHVIAAQLYNQLGIIQYRQSLNSSAGVSELCIPSAKLPDGLYFVVLTDPQNRSVYRKVMVRH